MEPTSGRLVFKIGAALPEDDPKAVFLVVVSTALNDLLTVARWLVGGLSDSRDSLAAQAEHLYLLRLSIVHLHEVRESVGFARRSQPVEEFIESLPADAQADLETLMAVETEDDDWLRSAMAHIRHQTVHYGGRWNWDDAVWALKRVAADDGIVEMGDRTLGGLRLAFADQILNQHLLRMVPELDDDADQELSAETTKTRLAELVARVADRTVAAQNFAQAAIENYFETLPRATIRSEPRYD